MDVVIVDDEAVNLTVIKQLVAKLPQCYPQAFTDASAALAWCKANDPDLVIVGYVMPEFDGIKFTQQLRALDGKNNTPVMMVTASTDARVRTNALASGVNDFLTKPFASGELSDRVTNLLIARSTLEPTQSQPAWSTPEQMPPLPYTPATAAQPTKNAKQLLNIETTLMRLSGDHVLLAEIARVFIRTVPKLLAAIRIAFSSTNMDRVYTEAHSLKGAVAAFDVPEVYNVVASLQRHALNNKAAAASAAFANAEALIGLLVAELNGLAQREPHKSECFDVRAVVGSQLQPQIIISTPGSSEL